MPTLHNFPDLRQLNKRPTGRKRFNSECRVKNMAEIVAADACRVVARGAKTGEGALTFHNSQLSTMNPQPDQPRYLGCYRRIKFSARESFRHRHGLEHGLGFVDGFLKFAFGRRIADPAAPGLHVSFAVLEQRGTDGDARVEIAVERKITDAAAVRSAGGRSEACRAATR